MGFNAIKWILAIFFCTIFMLTSKAQNNTTSDSLVQRLQNTQNLKSRARLLLKISKEEELRDPEKSLDYAQRALQESRLAIFDSAEVRSLIQIGVNLCRLKNINEAIETGEQIVEMASKLNMLMEIADGRSIMAVAYAEVGDFDNSSKLYFENLRLYEKLNNKRLIGRTLGNIGADFISMKSYEKAMEYANKSLLISKEINNLSAITDQFNNLAAIFQIGYNDLPKALHFYSEALKIAIKMDDFQQQGVNMLNIGGLYQKLNNPDSASYYLNHALELFKKVNNPVLMADGYIALGNFHFRKGDYQSGRKLASQGLSIGEKYQLPQTIFNASDLLYNICLSEYDTVGAFKYLVAKTKSNDRLYFLQNQNALFKLEFQYNQEKLIKDQKMRQMRNIFIFGFIILGLISGLIIIFLFYSRQKIKIKNMILGKEKMEADLKFKSKELSTNLMALLKKNELIAEINQKLTQLERTSSGNDLRDSLIKLNRDIKKSSENKLWQEFSVQFKETNSQFYDKLLKLYPDLTSRELQLCAYLRLNMTTKEIAELTGQRTDTLGQARYRLRKKFGLNNMESNLVTFLAQI